VTEPAAAYYCIVQFTPDQRRAEAVNVGVLLLSPRHDFIDVKLAASNKRIRRFFGPQTSLDEGQLTSLRLSLRERLRRDPDSFRTLESLEHFVATRANHLTLTRPRPIKVSDPATDLARLFEELVEEPTGGIRGGTTCPRLDAVLRRPELSGRLKRGLRIAIPVLGGTLRVPYAYRTTTLNLIYPRRFSSRAGVARKQACRLAAVGRLLARHEDPEHGRMCLVVVPEYAGHEEELTAAIEQVLAESEVRVVPPQELDALVAEIAEVAPALSDGETA
jgi:hypothetical protein